MSTITSASLPGLPTVIAIDIS